jgi:hypothetical protein
MFEQGYHFGGCGGPGQSRINGAGLQQGGLVFVQDIEARVYLGLGGMGAEDFGAEGMDGADAGAVQGGEGFLPAFPFRRTVTLFKPGLDGGTDAGAHLAGGLVGKSDGDDGAEGKAGSQQG